MMPVTGVRARPHLLGRRIDLSWQNPPHDAGDGALLAGIRILRQKHTFPLSYKDVELIIYDGPVINQFTDDGQDSAGLEPLTTYYYTIFAADNATTPNYSDGAYASAFATEQYNMAERLYKMLPAVHLRYDTLSPAVVKSQSPQLGPALDALPLALQNSGQLRRFFRAAAAPFDAMRSFAEGLRKLPNSDETPPEYLPLLAQWLDWNLDRTLPVFSQRNEVKFAPHLYRRVGTIPNLRAIVTRYTGWYAQVVEFAQHIARANMPPQLNIFALTETPQGWRGADDAAPVLGFDTGHNLGVPLAPGTPASLVGTLSEPFALRPGMEFTVTADNRLPNTVRFQPDDFLDIGNATAAEVQEILNRTLPEVTISVQNGKLAIMSHTTDALSSLRVEQAASSLVTIEGAPHGRLSTCTKRSGVAYLFYETTDPLSVVKRQAAIASFNGRLTSSDGQSVANTTVNVSQQLTAQPQRTIRYKCFQHGDWTASFPLQSPASTAQGDPAVVVRSDDRLWIAWIANPHTENASVYFMQETGKTSDGSINWSAPQAVPVASQGRYADLHAIATSASSIRLFWAEHGGGLWRIRDASWDGTNWSSAETVADGLKGNGVGANREPFAVLDRATRIWLFWSHLHDTGTTDSTWTIQRRVFDGTTWGNEVAVTAIPASEQVADREPSAIIVPNTDPQKDVLRVFLRSDRAGSLNLWSVSIAPVDPTIETPLQPVLLSSNVSTSLVPADHAPVPLLLANNILWLLYRSDRSISPSRMATRSLPALENRFTLPRTLLNRLSPAATSSVRVLDTGTLKRFAGTISAPLTNAARISRMGLFDDLFSYTPQAVDAQSVLPEDTLYTRGTVGLYISQFVPDSDLSQAQLERLLLVLQRFLPINVRAVVKLTLRVDVELVYPQGTGIQERFQDDYPYVDHYGGPTEHVALALPDWKLLLSNTKGDVSAQTSDLTTLRNRTFLPGILPPSQ